jgi:ribonuclease HI
MELLAAIRALQALKRPCSVELHTDSSYLRNAFAQGWLENWQRNGWRTKGGKGKVLNQDLWQELIHLTKTHQVQWHWVKAHAGHPENERADELAVAARKGLVEKED